MSALFSPVIAGGAAIAGSGSSGATALSTTGDYNCLKIECITNIFWVELGDSSVEVAASTGMLVSPGQVYYVSRGAETHIATLGAAGTIYVTPGYLTSGF